MSDDLHRRRDEFVVLDGVAKTYGFGELVGHALKPADLSISTGQFVVLLGPSGSGKTTFLDLVGGIERPTAGRVWRQAFGTLSARTRC